MSAKTKAHVNLDIAISGADAERRAGRIRQLVLADFGPECQVHGAPGTGPGLTLFLDYRGSGNHPFSKAKLHELKAFIRGCLAMRDACDRLGP